MRFNLRGATLLLLFAALPSAAADDDRWPVERTRQRHENLTLTAASGGRLLVVDNVCGSVRLRGHAQDTVKVTIDETIHARTERDADRAEQETTLRVVGQPDVVRLIADGPFRLADGSIRWQDRRYQVCYELTLEVPAKIDLDVRTINHGGIEIRGIEGDLVVRNVNGPLRLEAVAGSGELATVNGDIDLEVGVLPAQRWTIETVNGDVETRFPHGLAADLRLTTRNGEIRTDFEVLPRAGEAPQQERGADGVFRVRKQRAVLARVGSGGPEIAIETLNGDITLRRAGQRRAGTPSP